ncbi:hypothetical protein AAU57_14690 [Nonlabens sp. YIK11]|nr:hypothetical protein AAU57_14690 [Nonlabens sp. YIK11]
MKTILLTITCVALFCSFTSVNSVESIAVEPNQVESFGPTECCDKTVTKGEPGTDGYTTATATSCNSSTSSSDWNKDRACEEAQSRAEKVVAVLSPF